MAGWNKTESTLFSFSDTQVFSLDEAGLRKRIEDLAGSDADRLIKSRIVCDAQKEQRLIFEPALNR